MLSLRSLVLILGLPREVTYFPHPVPLVKRMRNAGASGHTER